jgi:2-dehydropantoate 2-reductase
MKICVYGAGAIGGAMAAKLARAGHDVCVVVRGAHRDAIRSQGLRCEGPAENFTVKVAASDDPGDFGAQDAVIVTVKAHTMPAIVPGLKRLLGAETPVVYAVNGIPWWYFHGVGGPYDGRRIEMLDPGGRLWDEVGVERAIGCVLNFPSSAPAPGVIRQVAAHNTISLGEPGGGTSKRLAALADAFRGAGVNVTADVPIRNEIWVKMQRIVSTSTITALTSLTVAQASGDVELAPVMARAMEETAAIGEAYGVPADKDIAARIAMQTKVHHRTSMLQDLDAGRMMEIDAQLTVPQRMARDAGVPTPTLDILIALLKGRARAAGLYQG